MRISELIRVDSRGRVIIPLTVRNTFDLRTGMYLMMVADLESREIRLMPFADPGAKLVEIKVTLKDIPGALARVATVLASSKVDLLSTQSRTLHRGEVAEWVSISDISKCKLKLDELRTKILEDGAAKDVKIQVYH